ncbi:MAG: hypothetical protein FWC50_12810 [Planctomycetaceae bacterium]|nr:hypothetical protein [Planctomycetaceae bacterium]
MANTGLNRSNFDDHANIPLKDKNSYVFDRSKRLFTPVFFLIFLKFPYFLRKNQKSLSVLRTFLISSIAVLLEVWQHEQVDMDVSALQAEIHCYIIWNTSSNSTDWEIVAYHTEGG